MYWIFPQQALVNDTIWASNQPNIFQYVLMRIFFNHWIIGQYWASSKA